MSNKHYRSKESNRIRRNNNDKDRIVTGSFISNERGFGFVKFEDADGDIYINPRNTKGAMYGDEVEILVYDRIGTRRAEGKVLRIISHTVSEVVGFLKVTPKRCFVSPDNQKIGFNIFVDKSDLRGAENGHKVVVKITKYPSDSNIVRGRIIKDLGKSSDPGVDILSVLTDYGIAERFPYDVREEASNISDSVSEYELEGRENHTDRLTVTIDGEDTKDFDDAISLEMKDGKYVLGVHIADVSHYVKENSPIDCEALSRGTSVYVPGKVIPMLPFELSDNICSLKEGEIRLTLSCIMTIDESGEITDHRIVKSYICVDKRLTYSSVNAMLIGEDSQIPDDIKKMLFMMDELSEIIGKRRSERGSIDFDLPESRIILDEKGRVTDIKPYERNKATRLIENFMLSANETVAEQYYWRKIPFLYRNHEQPDSEKIMEFARFAKNFGLTIKGSVNEIHPREIQKILDSIRGESYENLINTMALRSLKRAEYSPQCEGHFGLASRCYCHFTSPIRRYPDFQIHRIIKEDLEQKLTLERLEHFEDILQEVGTICSQTERKADEIERKCDRIKMASYMQQFRDYIFDGVISSVTSFGFYVKLENTVEGLVHISEIGEDYYYFNEKEYSICGVDTKKSYALGDKVKVYVKYADKVSGNIDFGIYNELDF